MYDPKTDKYPYPEQTDKHYLLVKKDDGTVFDKNYPYVDKRKSFLWKQFWARVLLFLIVFPASYVRLGLRIKGKKNLRKNKKLIKQGVISISNHVHMWDYIAIMNAVKPRKTYLLSWCKNISGESGKLVRLMGGIPIPEHDVQATFAYLKDIEDLINGGGWLHIYPEASMWEYYQPIRPFKRGSAFFACELNKPIIPFAFSYRKPNWIRRKIFKQIACFDLNIGEPLFRDETLSKKEQEMDLLKRSHDAVCRLAGIKPEENLYQPIFNNDKRIDYYTNEYGKGYKGSK